MNRQPRPNYPGMTVVQSPHLINTITTRYSPQNLAWPIIWYDAANLLPLWLTLEVNAKNRTNEAAHKPFFNNPALPEYYLDYLQENRSITALTGQSWQPGSIVISKEFHSSYDFIVSQQNQRYNTIDIDYVWEHSEGYRGLELTTFYEPMNDLARARYLVGEFIKKRPGRPGAHQFTILARVAEQLGIAFRLVFVNVKGKNSTEIETAGNVFVIEIDSDMARTLHGGKFPPQEKTRFQSWTSWLATL